MASSPFGRPQPPQSDPALREILRTLQQHTRLLTDIKALLERGSRPGR